MGSRKRIVLVDDSADDAEFVRRAVERHYPDAEFVVHRSGEEGAAALVASVADSMESGPDLVLLDLKLPRFDGHAVLRELRQRVPAASLPVVVFTSSREPGDIARAYAAGANSYVAKPVAFDTYQEVVGAVVRYWLDVNVRGADPSAGRHG